MADGMEVEEGRENELIKKVSIFVGTILGWLLWPIGYPRLWARKVSRFVLLMTNSDLFLFRKRDKLLSFKIVKHRRCPFTMRYQAGSKRMIWWTKPCAIDIEIPEEISLGAARALLCLQHIDSWFAEELFFQMTNRTRGENEDANKVQA